MTALQEERMVNPILGETLSIEFGGNDVLVLLGSIPILSCHFSDLSGNLRGNFVGGEEWSGEKVDRS